MNALSNGIKIIVEGTEKTFHTLNDWGFALGNNNYIGEPEQETNYINVPFRDGYIDASEAINGKRTYKKRSLSFTLAGKRDRMGWDSVISSLRNNIHGRICHLILDNDRTFYWRGRVYINDFDRIRELGQFTLSIPQADPYKYDVEMSNEPWKWDPFNFETGIIKSVGEIEVNGTETINIPSGYMITTPSFVCSEITSNEFTVTDGKHIVKLKQGTTRNPLIQVNGDNPVELTFNGKGKVVIMYRGGSL